MATTKVGAVEPNEVSVTQKGQGETVVKPACSLRLISQVKIYIFYQAQSPDNSNIYVGTVCNQLVFICTHAPQLYFKGCKYGDRASWCANISTSECYVNADTCCQTCAQLRRQNQGVHKIEYSSAFNMIEFE